MSYLPNKLLSLTMVGLAIYWTLGWYVPGLWMSTTLSIFSLLVGFAIMIKYVRGLYRVLVKGDRSEEGDGAHLAALGIPAIGASIIFGAMFTLSWNLAGQPGEWLGTPASNFSRLLLVGGCVAFYFTPDVQKQRLSLPSVVWLLVIMTTAVLSAFVLGAYVGDTRIINLRPIDWPTCPNDRPYWVASNSEFYHDASTSPWRVRIVPRRCFATPEEAEAAGFIPSPS